MQFLAHDTDLSGPMSGDELTEVSSDVWLPIEVPKVSCNVLKDLHPYIKQVHSLLHFLVQTPPLRNKHINPSAKVAAKYPHLPLSLPLLLTLWGEDIFHKEYPHSLRRS